MWDHLIIRYPMGNSLEWLHVVNASQFTAMNSIQPVEVRVIAETPDYLMVKLPFLDIPIRMSHSFFHSRRFMGYFILI